MKTGFAIVGFVLFAVVAQAQTRQYIDHRTYQPPNGQPAAAFFATVQIGTAVDERPGLVWGHDGNGWYWDVAGTPTPGLTPTSPPSDDCKHFNGYAVSDEVLARCISHTALLNPWTKESFSLVVGEVYRDTYGLRVLVLNMAADIGTTRRIVTVRIIRTADESQRGQLRAVYEDVFPWFPLMPGEAK